MLVNQIKGEQRVAQMVEHTHKEHHVESFCNGGDIPDRHAKELDIQSTHFCCEACLTQVAFISIDAEYPCGAPPLHFE